MASLPEIVAPLPRQHTLDRRLPLSATIGWLRAGWRDLWIRPALSLGYGFVVFLVSLAVVGSLFMLDWDYILFPALAGFMVVGPVMAVGLYEKSRWIERGEKPTLAGVIFVQAASRGQILFIGVLLSLLILLWMRAAVILYALFVGWKPFPGLDHVATMLLTTVDGWALLITGSVVGGLFAAFSFAISAFSIPMLLDERLDAFTAMGRSMALVWSNLPVMLAWGAIVLALTLAAIATGLLGLVVVFPVLGHATWHAYRAMRV